MARTTIAIMMLGAVLAVTDQANAQGRRNWPNRPTRQEVARAQGVPPGQLPPADLCRVWYDNRSNGHQSGPIDCRRAEAIAARDLRARVIYGENVYAYRGYGAYGSQGGYGNRTDPYGYDPRTYPDDRGVSRPGRNRDPRNAGGAYDPYYGRDPYYDRSRYTTPAFQSGYRDGLEKGREDARDHDSYDPNRHSWYRSATRGYENEYGSRAEYQARYREGFQSGYSEGYQVYSRR